MRWTAVIAAGIIALSTAPAYADCAGLPEPGSDAFDTRIRSMDADEIIARGVIADRVPGDAHAAWSIFIRSARYLKGEGPSRIEITSYSDGDLSIGSDEPGASKAASRDFLDERAGDEAIFFASPEAKRYDPGYRTGTCTYNRFGRRGVVEMQRFVQAALAGPDEAGPLPATGGPTTLVLVGLLALMLGISLRSAPRARRTT